MKSTDETSRISIKKPEQITIKRGLKRRWTWWNLTTALTSILCCPVLGAMATVYSILAYTDHRIRDYRMSDHRKRVSCTLAVTGMVFGAMVICLSLYMIESLIEAVGHVWNKVFPAYADVSE